MQEEDLSAVSRRWVNHERGVQASSGPSRVPHALFNLSLFSLLPPASPLASPHAPSRSLASRQCSPLCLALLFSLLPAVLPSLSPLTRTINNGTDPTDC
ncbi:hypothetical protein E2C01_042347 [Portunus trituberculatus]|uniref:Uncharacterized protein n=1 Tax=Portunus trituberculatus TaxID=210409 RepID=A0A5B7FM81_PORTR|nr:hypothetical protein [Portunus trituberculatus]